MDILIIEDEVSVANFLKKGLEEFHFNVTIANNGFLGSTLAIDNNYDIILLDLILPLLSGLEVCKKIRLRKKEIPIIMLTALGTVQDKVVGLENGADDYLTKPFHFEELLARIKALIRRKPSDSSDSSYQVGDLVMDGFKKTVTRNGKAMTLTLKEFTLLEILMKNKNRVLSRSFIAEAVWGIDFNRGTNLIDVYINYLRSKIDKGFPKQLIHTVIGMGYVIKD